MRENKIRHLFITPDVIFFSKNNELHLTGFYNAKLFLLENEEDINDELDNIGFFISDEDIIYKAPEVENDNLQFDKADVWSLGVILIEMLTLNDF